MSEQDFLARWSRRKRAAAKEERQDEPAPQSEQAPQPEPGPPAPQPSPAASNEPAPDQAAAEQVDLSALPSIDSITAATDITGFLQRGVPEELARSALRKAWTSDPLIRDFIGPSENAWDFNDPTAMPGFGPIDFTPDQVRQLAAKLVGDVQQASEQIERVLPSTAVQGEERREIVSGGAAPAPHGERGEIAETAAHAPPAVSVAMQDDRAAPQHENSKSRARRHGGALPG